MTVSVIPWASYDFKRLMAGAKKAKEPLLFNKKVTVCLA
jgi:hypothetical protein